METLAQDLFTIGFLAFLEGILSIDNAVVLALLARDLPPHQRKKALTYGLVGAFVFRFIALGFATQLMQMNWVKYVGGGYLLFISTKSLFFNSGHKEETGVDSKLNKKPHRSFWKTIVVIELTDIAFAIDSILAAIAITDRFWIVFSGGVMGVIMMRYAATYFMKLLDRFPRFETAAFYLVFLIGAKLVVEALRLPGIDFHHSHSPWFWGFWISMLLALLSGFISKKQK